MIIMHDGIERGDEVRIIATGVFNGYRGTVQRLTQHSEASTVFFWIVFIDHPWQRDTISWAFERSEIEKM